MGNNSGIGVGCVIQKDCEQATQRVVASCEEFRQFLQTEHENWCVKQEKAFQQFTERHHSELERVTSAYERHRVVYESLKVNTQALEGSLDEATKKMRQDLQSHQEAISERLTSSTEEVAEKVNVLRKEQDRDLSQQIASMKERIQLATQPIRDQLSLATGDLADLRRRSHRQHVALWVAVLAVFIMSAFSVDEAERTRRIKDGRPAAIDARQGSGGGTQGTGDVGSAFPAQEDSEAAGQRQTWTDAKGREIEATLVEVNGLTVRLRKTADGQTYEIPLSSLSEADQQYVRGLSKAPAP